MGMPHTTLVSSVLRIVNWYLHIRVKETYFRPYARSADRLRSIDLGDRELRRDGLDPLRVYAGFRLGWLAHVKPSFKYQKHTYG
jgi:hypothetical protein